MKSQITSDATVPKSRTLAFLAFSSSAVWAKEFSWRVAHFLAVAADGGNLSLRIRGDGWRLASGRLLAQRWDESV